MRLFLFLASALSVFAVHATTYYISPSGNDNALGTSQGQAWRTLSRLEQVQFALQPGDQVLLERGGLYRGTMPASSSGTAAAPIVYGAYGSGAAPVVCGSDVVTGWQPYQGNIWRAPVAGAVKQVYVGGLLQTLARYPNTGWLHMDQGNSTSLTDSDLGQPNGYWAGATAVIRASNWNYDLGEVSGFSNHTLTFPTIYDNPGNYQWGYFLRNKLSELDAPGEWYYDAAAGMLYLQAPGNANPNTLQVEAGVRGAGVVAAWGRSWIRVQGLAFKHQTQAGVQNDGANHITVTGCSFTDLYHGIRTVGSYNTYENSQFTRTYATAAMVIDDYASFTGNQLTDIAMRAGEGETNWGYFGIRILGVGAVVSNNRFDTVGYIGLAVNNDALVERNVLYNCLALLNDGSAITFDRTDGMVVRNNIVVGVEGNLESVAPDFPNREKISHGIYFGNTSIKNTLVENNTVANCASSGIHVDHTMVSSGIQVKNNVLFNNGIQITMSDYSNSAGTGAVPPYHVAAYDDVYSGNILYCLTKEQQCMRQYHCYGASPVDFGTYANNRYFNPYNELSIQVVNLSSGPKQYTLERWQAQVGEDAGSTRSPLRLAEFATQQELSGNLVQNGDFASNVNGWTGWPTNAQVSRVTDHLDNGALKAYLPDNSVYPSFSMRNPDQFPVQDQAWYRIRLSLQSDANGEVNVALKGLSQINNPYAIASRSVPFSSERRDLEMYFRSDRTDQAWFQVTNQWTDPKYYLDNVEVTKVSVAPIDPAVRNKLLVNDQPAPQTFTLPQGCWKDIDGNLLDGTITVPAMYSKVAYRYDGPDCMAAPSGGVKVKMYLGGALGAGSSLMRDNLHAQGLVPLAEPYTAMGYNLENAGATAASNVMQAGGALSVVDWVVVQLHDNNSGHTVAGRRAALLLRNGTVVTPEGSEVITFNASAAGRFISVRHRNHLGVYCTMQLTGNAELVDFTRYDLPTYGSNAQYVVDGRKVLWSGDANGDGTLKYTGSGNDRDVVLSAIGGAEPTHVATGYSNADVNMDGMVSYTGQGNDREPVLLNTGGSNSTSVRPASMP